MLGPTQFADRRERMRSAPTDRRSYAPACLVIFGVDSTILPYFQEVAWPNLDRGGIWADENIHSVAPLPDSADLHLVRVGWLAKDVASQRHVFFQVFHGPRLRAWQRKWRRRLPFGVSCYPM